MSEIKNYQGEIYRGGQKEGDRLEYSIWLEKAAELLGEIEKIRREIVRIAEEEPLAGTEFKAYQTFRDISEAINETQKILKKGGLNIYREKRLKNFVEQFEKAIEASEQLQKIKAFRGQTSMLVEKVRALIILDHDVELDLKNRRGFSDKNV
ncbi:MAG: hypothetical protein UX09_C0041G0002 [Candidatus Uhrbacteria bacterium GW2011_GWE2_45_35]|uniref:Uncharacterized protein n=1 Tax=Candidatus Uhrbacteria bacterium GW2011_GWE2_45_35 TaxID=1618993 RepID=A0A0G1MEX4_9BACT|nr:MAG: hypothetical protein UX09_C0041G0002 [Candidatus Uhrbacteria bacterium GW2011_GWE2_45_35]HBR80392.1 hypothetical protein [Candidatus Uhrbacteria bacterium]HCU32039.1 hypothetical protein [Candidatus Uhrbacteria bacterium]